MNNKNEFLSLFTRVFIYTLFVVIVVICDALLGAALIAILSWLFSVDLWGWSNFLFLSIIFLQVLWVYISWIIHKRKKRE